MALGKQIKRARKERGIDQGPLAAAIKSTQQKLSALERRDSKKSDLLKPIADYLEIPMEWFLKDDGSPVPPRPNGNAVERMESHDAPDFTESERHQQQLIRIGRMKSEQEIVALVELWGDIPKTARTRYMKMIVQDALKNGWIDEVSDTMMAGWSAREKIADLRKSTKSHTQ